MNWPISGGIVPLCYVTRSCASRIIHCYKQPCCVFVHHYSIIAFKGRKILAFAAFICCFYILLLKFPTFFISLLAWINWRWGGEKCLQQAKLSQSCIVCCKWAGLQTAIQGNHWMRGYCPAPLLVEPDSKRYQLQMLHLGKNKCLPNQGPGVSWAPREEGCPIV